MNLTFSFAIILISFCSVTYGSDKKVCSELNQLHGGSLVNYFAYFDLIGLSAERSFNS